MAKSIPTFDDRHRLTGSRSVMDPHEIPTIASAQSLPPITLEERSGAAGDLDPTRAKYLKTMLLRQLRLDFPEWDPAEQREGVRWFGRCSAYVSRRTFADSDGRGLCRDEGVALLGTEKISETTNGNQVESVWTIPDAAVGADGRRAAVLYTHDARNIVQNYSVGYLDKEGTFRHSFSTDATVSDAMLDSDIMGKVSAPEHADFVMSSVAGPNGEPLAVELTIASEWYDAD